MKELLTFEKQKAPIVITDRTGARGIDFRFKGTAVVIIGFLPNSKAEFLQSIGRSSRNAFQPGKFALCARTEQRVTAKNIFAYFDQVNATQLARLKQRSLIECATLMQRASMLIDTPLKTWNNLSVWKTPLTKIPLSKLKQELRKITRLQPLLNHYPDTTAQSLSMGQHLIMKN